MKRFLLCLAFLMPLEAAQAAAETGLSIRNISVSHHSRKIEMAVLYPGQGGKASVMGENGVFHGVDVHEGAAPLPGKFPLILLSHGWGGNFKRMGWLSKGLVERGAIVLAVNHPNSTTGDLNNLDALDHWTRAQDLTAALDQMLADPLFADHINTARIYAAGFSYGGWTALSLGGVKGERDGLDKFCNDPSQKISHCADILKAGIRIADIDRGKWGASYKDPRIAAVAAIDPALTWGLTKADTIDLNVPVMMIGLGEGSDRLHATDTSASGSNFEALLPTAKVERLAPANHFTALGICKSKGAEILQEEKDDPVCTDPAGTDRKAVLDKIIALIARQFDLN